MDNPKRRLRAYDQMWRVTCQKCGYPFWAEKADAELCPTCEKKLTRQARGAYVEVARIFNGFEFSVTQIEQSQYPYRIQLMWKKHKRAEGKTCGQCPHFQRITYPRRTFFKCDQYGQTNSAASDWRMRWPACGLITAPGQGDENEHPFNE